MPHFVDPMYLLMLYVQKLVYNVEQGLVLNSSGSHGGYILPWWVLEGFR